MRGQNVAVITQGFGYEDDGGEDEMGESHEPPEPAKPAERVAPKAKKAKNARAAKTGPGLKRK